MTEFCERLIVVSSDFWLMKNIVAPRVAKSLLIKLIFRRSFSLVCLLKSIAISL